MKKLIALVFILLMTLTVLASCESAVKEAYVDENGNIIVVHEDGKTEALGKTETPDQPIPVTAKSAEVDPDGNIVVTYSDGTTAILGKVKQSEEPSVKSVKEVTVNSEMHAVVSYTDGTTEDLGYVGVEVIPPLYTVTFVDVNGKTLSTQEVYRGAAAKAPDAPTVADATFDKWDADYTNIQSDITIHPVYIAAATYTVTFVDDDGKVLSTQSVISGHSAKAPSVSAKGDMVFDKWSTSFSNVKSDLTVTAQYRAKKTFTVTFKDYSGYVLSTVSVKEGENAQAPANPTRDGYTFKGWSSSINNITSNKSVSAQYDMKSGSNIVDISYVINADKTITVTLAVKGSVKFCGLDAEFKVPSGLTYKSLKAGDDAVVNYNGGTIYVSVAKSSNITKTTTLATVTFSYSSAGEFTLGGKVTSMTDQNGSNVSNSVIGKTIKVG